MISKNNTQFLSLELPGRLVKCLIMSFLMGQIKGSSTHYLASSVTVTLTKEDQRGDKMIKVFTLTKILNLVSQDEILSTYKTPR